MKFCYETCIIKECRNHIGTGINVYCKGKEERIRDMYWGQASRMAKIVRIIAATMSSISKITANITVVFEAPR